MMKRLVAALVLLLFCVSICVSSYFVVNSLTEKINDNLQEALELIEKDKTQEAIKKIDISEEKWRKYKTFFDIFLDHTMLEELNVDLPSIKPMLESGSKDTAKEKIEDSINALKNVTEEQELSIGNIL